MKTTLSLPACLVCCVACAQTATIEVVPADYSQELTVTLGGSTYTKKVFGVEDDIREGWLRAGWSQEIGEQALYEVTAEELRSILQDKDVHKRFRALQIKAVVNDPRRNEMRLNADEYRLLIAIQASKKVPEMYPRFIQEGGSWVPKKHQPLGYETEWSFDWSHVAEPPAALNDNGRRIYLSLVAKAKRYHEAQRAEWQAIEERKQAIGADLFREK